MGKLENSNKSLVKDYYETVVNTGNVSRISEFISENYTEVFQNETSRPGIEGAIKHIQGVRENYTDLNLRIDYQIAEGDLVATCYTMTGTHNGNWMGIKPTGKRICVTGVNIDKIKNGKMIEHGGAANLFDALSDIGAIKIIEQ
ncbi:MAG: ester cyclase [Bacteroidetes bacterium]|nr:ester cyclase [Bacteroidota bacterium]